MTINTELRYFLEMKGLVVVRLKVFISLIIRKYKLITSALTDLMTGRGRPRVSPVEHLLCPALTSDPLMINCGMGLRGGKSAGVTSLEKNCLNCS